MRRISLLTAAILSVQCLQAQKDPALLAKILTQARVTAAEAHPVGKSPFSVDHGRHEWLLEGIAGWRSGFWPGTQWYLYEATGDGFWKEQADRSTRQLAAILDKQANSHDIGFQFYCSYGNAYRITKDEAYAKVMLRAADSLATLFDAKYGTICSWAYRKRRGEWPHHTIIDNMMNLELLMWASANGGSPRLREIAVTHANTTIERHFRPDNAAFHVLDYSLGGGGRLLRKTTWQGASDSSAWARGQAWALYGFSSMYRLSGDRRYLDQARKLAAFILDHPRLPKDGIPYWDFDAPEIPNTLRDASAGSILASAFLEMSGQVKGREGDRYLRAAENILTTLSTDTYLAAPGTNGGFLLKHSVGALPLKGEVDVALTYADYYFVEAMMRYLAR